ncbi:MAG: hypothetical protein UT05_C0004G0035 [Parcubacteria group bacterium GW2011_GWF2_38_76]|nr:MAG: hypothetical protein UT05_C0004G0035 [Parcubacteria group bacterium GW2011_GWF2_38_76]
MSGGIVFGENERFILPGDRPIDSVADGIAYIKVSDYFECGFSRFHDVVSEIKRKKLNSKIILDFRGSSAVDLKGAIEVIETFIGPGKVAYIKENKEDGVREKTMTGYPKENIKIGKIVCLADTDTNVPSEIIVLALKYHLFNFTTVGKQTTGNLECYRYFPSGIARLPYGFNWLSSSGVKITNTGITPAYEVVEDEPGRDLATEKAIELLNRE